MKFLWALSISALAIFATGCSGVSRDHAAKADGSIIENDALLTVMPMYWEGEAAPVSANDLGTHQVSFLRDIDLASGEVQVLARESCHDGAVRGWEIRCTEFTFGGTAFVSLSRRVIVAAKRAE